MSRVCALEASERFAEPGAAEDARLPTGGRRDLDPLLLPDPEDVRAHRADLFLDSEEGGPEHALQRKADVGRVDRPVEELVAGRDGDESGSIIGIVATDAPLLPHQCDRLAQRAGLGVGRMGGTAAHSSGDIFFAFATGNRGVDGVGELPIRKLSDTEITPFYDAVIESTEEAILNAMLASETMTGRDGNTVHALDPELLLEALPRQA